MLGQIDIEAAIVSRRDKFSAFPCFTTSSKVNRATSFRYNQFISNFNINFSKNIVYDESEFIHLSTAREQIMPRNLKLLKVVLLATAGGFMISIASSAIAELPSNCWRDADGRIHCIFCPVGSDQC